MEDLHDATLLDFKVDWKSGDVQFDFKVSRKNKTSARIFVKQISNLECPRHMPWGSSVSVNKIIQQEAETGVSLAIEMQSGDYIKLIAQSFILEFN